MREFSSEPRVAFEIATEQSGVRLATLVAWAARGVLSVERHGKTETVLLSEVRALASWERHRRPETLRERLRDAAATQDSARKAAALQRVARDRDTGR
jgi:hypothetical protein